jgi:hypothetical protein
MEFPVVAVMANISWELLWGFVFKLDFGGAPLLYLWRAGTMLDAVILYGCIRYGRYESTIPVSKRAWPFLMVGGVLLWGVLNYSFTKQGYDLPMGFNSGMILNLMMSALCILLVLRNPAKEYSLAVAILRTAATDILFMAYIMMVNPAAHFAITLGTICLALDLYYIYLLISLKNKRRKAVLTT